MHVQLWTILTYYCGKKGLGYVRWFLLRINQNTCQQQSPMWGSWWHFLMGTLGTMMDISTSLWDNNKGYQNVVAIFRLQW